MAMNSVVAPQPYCAVQGTRATLETQNSAYGLQPGAIRPVRQASLVSQDALKQPARCHHAFPESTVRGNRLASGLGQRCLKIASE